MSIINLTNRHPHRLGKKMAPGVYNVEHPEGCGCAVLMSVGHARWVSWNALTGRAFCDHCKTEITIPLPAVRENWFSKEVRMDVKAVEEDLWGFQLRHENCPPPVEDQPCGHGNLPAGA